MYEKNTTDKNCSLTIKFLSSYCLLHHMRIEMKCLIIFHHIVSSLKTNNFQFTHTYSKTWIFFLPANSVLSSLFHFFSFIFSVNFISVRDNNKFGRLVSAFSSCEIIYGWKSLITLIYNFVREKHIKGDICDEGDVLNALEIWYP